VERARARKVLDAAAGGGLAPLARAAARALATVGQLRTVVLVEGVSDQEALEATAELRGRHLEAEGALVVSMGGATNIAHFLALFGPDGLNLRLAGLCDEREAGGVQRSLERVGLGVRDWEGLEALGFYLCSADLEDELIRMLGAETVEGVVAAQGELVSFRRMQQQPAQRGRRVEDQLRRFMGSGSGRKIRYARLLVEALDPARVPRPLDGVLGHL
jgi:hypothetical protein